MGCVFCATGQMGLLRNMTPGEIVAQEQVEHLRRALDVLRPRAIPSPRTIQESP